MRTRLTGRLAVLCLTWLCARPVFAWSEAANNSGFERAIRANDLAALKTLAGAPGAAGQCDKLKNTPLHYAAVYGSAEAISILATAGANPNARNQAGATPLLYAAWDFERTRTLVEHGADVNAAEPGGNTPLMVAASAHGNARTVAYLLEKGAQVGARDKYGDTALTRSDLQSDRETVTLLLAHGADAKYLNGNGTNALEGSIGQGDTERTKKLLAAGADPNQANKFAGQVRKGPLALVHLTPLMLAAPSSDSETITLLLQAGARVNERDIRKMTPLSFSIATDRANPATVRQLIAAGADVNAVDGNGESALTWARKYRNPEILAILQAAGAKGKELSPAPQPEAGAEAANAGEAVKRSLPLLAGAGKQFFSESGCAGCHHTPVYARAYAAAASAGLQPDQALRKNFLDSVSVLRPFVSSSLPMLIGPGGDFDPLLAYLTSYADLGEPADAKTDLMIHYIAVRQDPCGAWIMDGVARPPLEESTITRTAFAMRALKLYGWQARRDEFSKRIEKAQAWLAASRPATTYERADKITGLSSVGVDAAHLRGQAEELLHLQRADGGWAQTQFLDSDAYATGLVLHTLYTAGLLSPNEEAYRRGAGFLLRTQFRDGSWYVRSRAVKFQPYFQSGFPFDHDQWISSAATSLAVMALAPAAQMDARHMNAKVAGLR